jgi:spore coat protein I
LFPHWFFGLVKNQYQNAKLLKTAEIERTAELELSKVQLLAKA